MEAAVTKMFKTATLFLTALGLAGHPQGGRFFSISRDLPTLPRVFPDQTG